MTLTGSCHCGDVSLAFETGKEPGEFTVRTCQCSFCRKHGARAVADPEGQLTVSLTREDAARRYQFDAKTADFVVCRTCGAYVCAILEADGAAYSTININVLDGRAEFPDDELPVTYDTEAVGQRIERRIATWTPTKVIVYGE